MSEYSHLNPNKQLGQNFFSNKSLAEKIVELTLESKPDKIVEIGPGRGAFTHLFSKSGKEIIVIEKDQSLLNIVSNVIRLKSVNNDILDLDLQSFVEEFELTKDTVIFGSLPYNISKKIIMNFLQFNYFERYFFIIQKEVANRYIAIAPQNTLLATITGVNYEIRKVLDIKPGSFTPPPKVNSSLISIIKRDKSLLSEDKIEEFRSFLQSLFKSPRKKIRNNIKISLEEESSSTGSNELLYLEKRAEELSLEQLISLFNKANL